LYAGLILTRDGPKLLEFNCRFGDPETQVSYELNDINIDDIMISHRQDMATCRSQWRSQR